MKILFVISWPIPDSGPAWSRIEFFSRYFVKNGHKVNILSSFSMKTFHRFGRTRMDGIRIVNFIPIIMMINLPSLLFNVISSIVVSFFVIIYLRPQTVIISVPVGETALGVYLWAKILRRRIVFDYRDLWEDMAIDLTKSYTRVAYGKLKDLMTVCYMKSNVIVTVTERLYQALVGRGLKNVEIVPNGADCNTFKPYESSPIRNEMGYIDSDFILIYSGMIGNYYNLDLVLEATKIATGSIPSLKLIVAGQGPDIDRLLSKVKDLKIESIVSYIGAKTNKSELAHIISASDLGLIPYDSQKNWVNLEGAIPVKTFEYCACGLPVLAIARQNSTIANLIKVNDLGLVSEPGNVELLTQNIMVAYFNNLHAKISNRAVNFVRKNFDRNKSAIDFMELVTG